jgi:hypothetical protein
MQEMQRGSSSLATLSSRFRTVIGDGHKLTQAADVDIIATTVEYLSKHIHVNNTVKLAEFFTINTRRVAIKMHAAHTDIGG